MSPLLRVSREAVTQMQRDFSHSSRSRSWLLFRMRSGRTIQSTIGLLVRSQHTTPSAKPTLQPCCWRCSPLPLPPHVISHPRQPSSSRGFETPEPWSCSSAVYKRNPTERCPGDSPMGRDRRVGTCCFCDRVRQQPCCVSLFAVFAASQKPACSAAVGEKFPQAGSRACCRRTAVRTGVPERA